ncbi:MAG TPA: hypothetical protein VKB86_00280 [Pyrinomonadaceae bacterium]|nr:hypothetical protein [Pyrinomonadaceae bacterium]
MSRRNLKREQKEINQSVIDAEVWAQVNTPDTCWTCAAEAVTRVLQSGDESRRAIVEEALRRFAELVNPQEVFPDFNIHAPSAFTQLCYCMKKNRRICPKNTVPCNLSSCPYCLAHRAECQVSGLAYAADDGKTLEEIEDLRKDLCITYPLPTDARWEPRTFRITLGKGGDWILKQIEGDTLVCAEFAEMRDDDFCAGRWTNFLGMTFYKFGRYRQEADGDFTIVAEDGDYTYDSSHRNHLLRVITVERTPRRPEDGGMTDETERHLRFLRARLEHLNESDDITDCTARFKLEREIYDLEHKLGDDEWPEVIGDE